MKQLLLGSREETAPSCESLEVDNIYEVSTKSVPDFYLGTFSKPWHKDIEPKETAAVQPGRGNKYQNAELG